ncbi:VOC family protein [Pectobacteriaceae bacterium CE90]|nr:VOC family protein [Prodigiosinella sp. LS101]WJV53010.1 VOC family protein [Prodigiosinella sp. LS101]WJV57365.1 VOC family protein [Pectobacteriaceae bacterium C111]WJY15963.1 VOC family protein [Pectobacteriaceae bacterium CE90]
MEITHVALWTRNLDAQVLFWQQVFGGKSNARYISQNRPGFESHFITLTQGPTVELMTLPALPPAPEYPEFVGWAHIAVAVGASEDVDRLAENARQCGTLLSPPRLTGDGYYEAVIADPDGNRIELVAK